MPRIEVNGFHLNVQMAGTGEPLMLLHGFTGDGAGWLPFADHWRRIRLIAVDIVGHGESDSPVEIDHYRMEACVEDLAGVLDALGVAKTALLGYSMGGRAALHFALGHGERVSALILESAAAGYADPGERTARVKSDEALADGVEKDGIEAFVDHWQSIPLWDSQSSLPEAQRQALRKQRLRNSHFGLANSLRGMGAGAQEPVMERLREIEVPVLFLAGELDGRYVSLAREMSSRVAGSEVRIIPGAGHAAHFERPAEFAAEVAGFLDRCLSTNRTGGAR